MTAARTEDVRVAEAGLILGVSAREVLRLIDEGELSAHRHPNGHLCLSTADLRAYRAHHP